MDKFTKLYLKIISEQADSSDIYFSFKIYGPDNDPNEYAYDYEDFATYIDNDLLPKFFNRFNIVGSAITGSDQGGNPRTFEAHLTSVDELKNLLTYTDGKWCAEPLAADLQIEEALDVDDTLGFLKNFKGDKVDWDISDTPTLTNGLEGEELCDAIKTDAEEYFNDFNDDDYDENIDSYEE